MVWKRTLDDVIASAWARHQDHAHREAARRQQLLVEQAAHARIVAAHRQQLLDEQAAARAHHEAAAAHARHDAARRQLEDRAEAGLKYATHLFAQCIAEDHAAGLLYAKCLFNQCADTDRRLTESHALARQQAAARTIFLWLRRRRLHIRLARQTSRCLQRVAALARLRYKDECCARVANQHRSHKALTSAKAADEGL